MPRRMFRSALTTAALMSAAFVAGVGFAEAPTPKTWLTPLISSGETVMGEKVEYPTSGPAKITAAILTLAPGQETGWHTHGVPTSGIMLEGELTVDYGEKGTRIYRQGDAVIEAMKVAHNGKNTGSGPMRVFAVFMGAEGVPNTVPMADKK